MASHRLQRVRELLKREIGEAIRREIPVDTGGLVSVNEVELAGDLRIATVFISILGSSEQQRTGLSLLQKNRVRIQAYVAKAVILKYTPQLRFVIDDSVARGNKVLAIIEELEKQSPSTSNS